MTTVLKNETFFFFKLIHDLNKKIVFPKPIEIQSIKIRISKIARSKFNR